MNDELRAALKRGAPDLAYARHFAAPDNPIVGDTLAWRLDRAGVRAVLAYLEGEPDAARARLEAEREALRDRAAAEAEQAADIIADATAERDAARAALDGLLADVEHFAIIQHRALHGPPGVRDPDRPPSAAWRDCRRDGCPGLRRAVARARAATGHGGAG